MKALSISGPLSISKREWTLLSVVLGVLLLLGIILVPSHGQSTDEFSNYQYAADALRTYAGTRVFVGPFFQGVPIDWLYGPFHFEAAYLLGAVVERLPLGWTATDGRHLATFLVFLLGGAGIYALSRRGLQPFAASVATGLFLSQPLIWGQAFTNQKDIPFLAYFILAMAIGLAAVDRLEYKKPAGEGPAPDGVASDRFGWLTSLTTDMRALQKGRRVLIGAGLLALGSAVVATLWGAVFLPAARWMLAAAYHGNAIQPIQLIFDRVATDAYKTPLSLYLDKMDLVYAWAKIPLALAWLTLLLALIRARLTRVWQKGTAHVPQGSGMLLVAGGVLGLANSIRVAAPLAGGLVGLYLLVRLKRRAWVPLAVYGLAALVVTYLTWPWLWQAPIANYWESLKVMSRFPSHKVLFEGVVYASSDIPWDYVPKLVAIQTTAVLLPLSLIGLWVAARRVSRGDYPLVELTLWLLWFIVPVGLVIGLHSSLYGNLRQMLFILPPLFLLSGWAIEWVVSQLAGAVWRIVVSMVVLAPGILAIVLLHPYADSYFNGWVGWTSGAYGRYQVDSWCTSYREAVTFLNLHAPKGAVVDVRGPFRSAVDFARPDLDMHPDFQPSPTPDYALMCQIDILGNGYHGNLPVVYRVTRGKAVLAVVRGSH
jgi:hypothetical protein